MAENGEAALNSSQPELLHMLWNLTVCCPSLMGKAMLCFLPFHSLTCFLPVEADVATHTSHLYFFFFFYPPRPPALLSCGASFAESARHLPALSVRGLHQILRCQFASDEIMLREIAAR